MDGQLLVYLEKNGEKHLKALANYIYMKHRPKTMLEFASRMEDVDDGTGIRFRFYLQERESTGRQGQVIASITDDSTGERLQGEFTTGKSIRAFLSTLPYKEYERMFTEALHASIGHGNTSYSGKPSCISM